MVGKHFALKTLILRDLHKQDKQNPITRNKGWGNIVIFFFLKSRWEAGKEMSCFMLIIITPLFKISGETCSMLTIEVSPHSLYRHKDKVLVCVAMSWGKLWICILRKLTFFFFFFFLDHFSPSKVIKLLRFKRLLSAKESEKEKKKHYYRVRSTKE